MQAAFTTFCERMGQSKELTEFEHGAVIGRHHCNQSYSTISSKWCYCLGSTATQPWSGRSCKHSEQCHWVLRCIVYKGCQCSPACRGPKLPATLTSAQKLHARSSMELVSSYYYTPITCFFFTFFFCFLIHFQSNCCTWTESFNHKKATNSRHKSVLCLRKLKETSLNLQSFVKLCY